MNNQRVLFWKNNMNFGAIAGFGLIAITVILYFLNIQESFLASLFFYVVLISTIVVGTKYLKKIENGRMSYGRALGSGTLISLFASIIVAVYMFVFLKFIDTDAMQKMYDLMEVKMAEQGLPDEQLEMSLEMAKKFTTPLSISIMTVFSYTFWGFVFSLVTAAFLKKKSNGYDAAMAEIEKEINEENK